MKTTISIDKKDFNEPDKKDTKLPSCYGNYNSLSAICQQCTIKAQCKKIPPPNDVDWCCNPP